MAVSVFVVDDHAMVRNGIVQVINLERDISVVGDGPGSAETLQAVRRAEPEVLIVDLEMPAIRGADFIALAKDTMDSLRVLVCTMHAAQGYISEALRRGTDGYVLKSSPSSVLVEGIRTVARGQTFVDPALGPEVERLLRDQDQLASTSTELTAQEIEVLRLAAEGLSNPRIAGRTGQSMESVKLRLRRSYQKLGVTDRASAVAAALRRGLI